MSKKKLLFYGDTPTVATGFGIVSKNILKRLQATGKYEISVLGINYYGQPHDLPYKIYPAGINKQNDVYGRQELINMLMNNDYDILFTLQDTFVMKDMGESICKVRDGYMKSDGEKKIMKKGKGFKWMYYFPIDASPKQEWIDKSVALCDIAIPYTEYAKKECQKFCDREYHVIYHGFDAHDFYVMDDAEKQDFRDKDFKGNALENKFFIVNVNRNQERKGLMHTLLAFKMFNQIFPQSILYTHCDVSGDRGGNLIDLAVQIGLTTNWLYPNPEAFAKGYEFPIEYMNGLYNVADVNISTTFGEGMGLSLIESMATKTLNIFPDNTSLTELLADDRGVLVKSGNTPNNLIFNGHLDNNLLRPTVDVMDMVNKMIIAYRNKEKKKEIEENAYQWAVENLNWDDIVKKFDALM